MKLNTLICGSLLLSMTLAACGGGGGGTTTAAATGTGSSSSSSTLSSSSSSSSSTSSSSTSSSSSHSSSSSSSSSSPPTGNGTATLNWTPPTTNADGTALTNLAGYHIYYGTSSTAMTEVIQISNVGTTTYVVTSLGTGTWYFAIKAYTTSGSESAASNVASKTIS